MINAKIIGIAIISLFYSCGDKNEVGSSSFMQSLPPGMMFKKMHESQTNIRFQNLLPENTNMHGMEYEYYYNGGGVALADLDNDGLPELFFTGNRIYNKLYKNLGNFKFRDITKESGITDGPSWTTGVSLADINNDGILDIYICRSGMLDEKKRANLFFLSTGIENGIPKYIERAGELGLADVGYSTQSLFFDYDRDNDLDMFLINHNVEVKSYTDLKSIKEHRDALVGDKLYRNDGFKFTDVSVEAGIISNEIGYGLGVSAGDLNNDGWPDIYITNDYSEHDYLYFNNGDGTFSEQIKKATGHISNSAMGSDIGDFNNDGWLDIIVMDMLTEDNYGIKTSMSNIDTERFEFVVSSGLHYQYMVNTLQLNMGNSLFSEVANLAGMTSTNWSWSPLLADFDNDGFKDLFITNGIKRDFINYDFIYFKNTSLQAVEKNNPGNMDNAINGLIKMTPQRKVSNYMFKNNGDLTFSNKSTDWGFDAPSFSNGAAYGDLDNDGDLDIVINNVDDYPFIYQNMRSAKGNNYLKIKFQGPLKNNDGLGARVEIQHGSNKQIQEQYLTRGYQSAKNKMMHFGLGKDTIINQLKISWPDGRIQIIADIRANQEIDLKYNDASSMVGSNDNYSMVLFKKMENAPILKHEENFYDDFSKEGLLPFKFSRMGPGITVGDVNGDELDDFFIGGAKGFSGALFLQKSNGIFSPPIRKPFATDKTCEDIEASFFDADNDGDLDLYVVSGGNEFQENDRYLRDRLYINIGDGKFHTATNHLPDIRSSNSCVKPCDFDNDGDIDLFVGGRLVPGKYPFPTSSYLLENNQGKFKDVTKEKANALLGLGMVTDAVWADYNNDGWKDMVVVGEWMPITFLKNENGSFSGNTNKMTLARSSGWWYSLASADIDNDGDIDFIAGNLGLNSRYKTSDEQPFQVFAADFDNSGTMDIVFGFYNDGKLYPYKSRNGSITQMPFLKKKFKDFHSFGLATLKDVYGEENLKNALHYSVATFATSYIENTGNGNFKMRPLENMAQLSSVKSILVDDINLDGNPDLLIAGNSIYTDVETTRIDGSYGMVMLGDGHGDFSAIHPSECNFYLTGEIPDIEIIRIGSDSELGIVSIQNNGNIGIFYRNSN